jgi:hypothetical protein
MRILFDNGTPRGLASALVLSKGRWRLIRNRLPEIAAAVESAMPGSFTEVEIPGD